MRIPKQYQAIVKSIKRKARRHNVQIRFSLENTVHSSEFDKEGSGGYFYLDSDNRELAVATKAGIEKWITILIHESCHLDQEFDKSIEEKIKEWRHSYIMYMEWLAGVRELNKRQISKYKESVMECELDCDVRSVAKIKKFNLPIDIDKYIQQSNSYRMSYHIITERRRWFNYLYDEEKVWMIASKNFTTEHNVRDEEQIREMELSIDKT